MITSLRLQNFRSYSDSSFEFEQGVNIVVGPNASGKTNLLEAVLVLARGKSFRVREMELIQIGKEWARLDGFFDKDSRTVKLQNGQKTYEIGDKSFKRLSLERTVPVVFFEPNHLQLLSRGPDARRDYIDDLLERSQPGFKTLAGSYKRTLAQRNALLKHGQRSASQQLFAWNIRLSELGSQIVQARQKLIDDINQKLSKTYSQISKRKSQLKLKYASQFPVDNYGSRLLSKLESNPRLEFERGFTVYGPHREDFLFYLNNQPVSQTASRGESRSLLLSLKIFELGLIETIRSQKPIFLLDDVFSELDGARRQSLVKHLKNHQTIITTTDADAVLEHFDSHHLITL
jgi:DNA replication and repair protein RecF